MALPTNGRVIVDTSAGEIDIELWSKVRTHATATAYSIPNPSSQEAPKTCRNFIQLAMEGQWHAVLITVSDPPNMPSQVTMTVSSSTGESPASCPSTAQSELMGLRSCLTRIVPNFLVQTGDRTGTGGGGESVYGGTLAARMDTSSV